MESQLTNVTLPATGASSILVTDMVPLSGPESIVDKVLCFEKDGESYCALLSYI